MAQLPVEVASNSRFAQQLLPSYGEERSAGANDVLIGRKVRPPAGRLALLQAAAGCCRQARASCPYGLCTAGTCPSVRPASPCRHRTSP